MKQPFTNRAHFNSHVVAWNNAHKKATQWDIPVNSYEYTERIKQFIKEWGPYPSATSAIFLNESLISIS